MISTGATSVPRSLTLKSLWDFIWNCKEQERNRQIFLVLQGNKKHESTLCKHRGRPLQDCSVCCSQHRGQSMYTTVPYSKAAFELESLLSHRDRGVSSLYLKPLPPLGSHSPNGYLQGIYHLLGKFFFFLSKCSSKHGPQTSTRFHTAHYWSATRSVCNEE